jgi:hypothetical protein
VSVTAQRVSATRRLSRNKAILAEWEAEQARHAEYESRNPEAAAHLNALAVALNGGQEATEDERRAGSLAHHAEHCAYWCSRCRSEFSEGDVVYRRRAQGEPSVWGSSWRLEAICDQCVRKDMHPTWREHRREPVPCAGGCGVLVSHWYYEEITTCSRRCSERVAAERRRVKREARQCEVCDEEFTPARSDARYCSNACRQDAYRKRKANCMP